MGWKEFFRPSFAKILWFMAFFVISFESLWIQILCIKGSCGAWYFRLPFWVFSWPFALRSVIHFQNRLEQPILGNISPLCGN